MVAEIIEVFTDAFTAMTSALITLITDAFDGLVYNGTDGLNPIAVWALVFAGVALVLGIVQRFVKA
jgi:hypothetical protein